MIRAGRLHELRRYVDAGRVDESRIRGPLHRSRACRIWYHWRCVSNGWMPFWVTLSAPWPVVRLACRMTGKSRALAALSIPFAFLAVVGDGHSDDVMLDRRTRVKSTSRLRALTPRMKVER